VAILANWKVTKRRIESQTRKL